MVIDGIFAATCTHPPSALPRRRTRPNGHETGRSDRADRAVRNRQPTDGSQPGRSPALRPSTRNSRHTKAAVRNRDDEDCEHGLLQRSGHLPSVRGRRRSPQMFGDEQLDKLRENVAGRQTLETSDGIEAGWSGGKSVLDTTFDLAKNIINDTLHFDFRVDTDRLPGDLLKAYYEADLAALIKDNKSGFASAKQKREAKESAHNRLKVRSEGRAIPATEVYPGAVGSGRERSSVRGHFDIAGRQVHGTVHPHVRAPSGVAHRRPARRANSGHSQAGGSFGRRFVVRSGCRWRGRVGNGWRCRRLPRQRVPALAVVPERPRHGHRHAERRQRSDADASTNTVARLPAWGNRQRHDRQRRADPSCRRHVGRCKPGSCHGRWD